MTYPNSPLDEVPVVWGWPWHGLIESPAQAGPPCELILPSGKRMPCSADGAFAHNTHLWDIGMAEPDVESDDPDEQWLNRAIVRSQYLGGPQKSAFCYGDMSFGLDHPMYVPMFGVLRRQLALQTWGVGANQGVLVSLSVGRRFVTSIELSRAQLQIPNVSYLGNALDSYRIQLMDESPDGRSALYWIAPRRLIGATEYLTVGRTLLEVSITGDPEVGFGLTHRLVAPYSVQAEVYRYPKLSDKGEFMMVRWADSPTHENIVAVRGNQTPPPGYDYWVGEAPDGTAVHSEYFESPVWAWYNPDGSIEVTTWRKDRMDIREYTTTAQGAGAGFSMVDTRTVTLTNSKGSVSGVHVYRESRSVAGGILSWETGESVYGEQLYTESGSYPIEGSWSEPVDWAPDDPPPVDTNPVLTSTVYPDAVIIISNNILATRYGSVDISGIPNTEVWCGDALYPGGVDHGLKKFEFGAPGGGTLSAWQIGSYNPITGQVVRNLSDRYRSWV
jgi:hypothetical protein